MLDPSTRLCPNRTDVASKILDGEAILINLSDGLYYSLDAAAGLVWEMIDAEHTLGEISDVVSLCYEVDADTARTDVHRLAEELVQANLAEVSSRTSPARPLDDGVSPSPRQPYEPLRLNAYRDMAELLALDPPHPLLTDTLSNYTPES